MLLEFKGPVGHSRPAWSVWAAVVFWADLTHGPVGAVGRSAGPISAPAMQEAGGVVEIPSSVPSCHCAGGKHVANLELDPGSSFLVRDWMDVAGLQVFVCVCVF